MREAVLHFSLTDDYDGTRHAVALPISTPFIEAWEPVDLCDRGDVALLMRMGGKNAHTEETVRRVRRMREHYVKILAEKMAKAIMESMEANDTRNGWQPDGSKRFP